jgi:hypothetical protein
MPKNGFLQYFEYDHIAGPAKAHSQKIANLANELDRNVPDNSEKEFALRKLLEARDAVVRACKP